MNKLNEICTNEDTPCRFTFKIGENLQSFNSVVEIFRIAGFTVQEFIGDHMCILAREKEGINEAVKIKRNNVQIQAWKNTLNDLCDELSVHCKEFEES
ncbi:MAG: hypothetical protein GNW80_14260 [Asgard group archaeon]|nr:hypothetical protein [Asgard group archaeon]